MTIEDIFNVFTAAIWWSFTWLEILLLNCALLCQGLYSLHSEAVHLKLGTWSYGGQVDRRLSWDCSLWLGIVLWCPCIGLDNEHFQVFDELNSLSYGWNEQSGIWWVSSQLCGGGPCNFSVRPIPNWTLDFWTDLGLGFGLGLGGLDLGLGLDNI